MEIDKAKKRPPRSDKFTWGKGDLVEVPEPKKKSEEERMGEILDEQEKRSTLRPADFPKSGFLPEDDE
ncbi:MAG: hypothetical protein QGF68_11140 [Nitrospinota bacterium]|jgi:hypothetical protein|nr:hypothetical protein [Nitrospinota bacterium]HJM41968.1 hypothetical protein [Nitrospinota bacterium]